MKFIATAVFALLVGVVAVGVADTPVSAAENKNQPTTQQTEATYDYVAQAGDSYSLFARKAVQTYGKKFNVKLDLSQVMFAETHLTQAAGSPALLYGEKIVTKESVVKSWVEKAQKLTTAQKQAWYPYTVHADFNTDSVGESR